MIRRAILIPALLLVLAAPFALAADAPTTILVVRHAEKTAPKGDPPLSEAGAARAAELARTVGQLEVGALFATQYRRTQDTLAPLAAHAGLEVTVARVESVEESARELARRILAEHRGQVVVVAGHSNTVPAIVAALGGDPPAAIADDRYDDLFVVTVGSGGVTTLNLKYGSPAP
jgi:broad specificity phosphatase PhoE